MLADARCGSIACTGTNESGVWLEGGRIVFVSQVDLTTGKAKTLVEDAWAPRYVDTGHIIRPTEAAGSCELIADG